MAVFTLPESGHAVLPDLLVGVLEGHDEDGGEVQGQIVVGDIRHARDDLDPALRLHSAPSAFDESQILRAQRGEAREVRVL